jgi:hypothetical protein
METQLVPLVLGSARGPVGAAAELWTVPESLAKITPKHCNDPGLQHMRQVHSRSCHCAEAGTRQWLCNPDVTSDAGSTELQECNFQTWPYVTLSQLAQTPVYQLPSTATMLSCRVQAMSPLLQ